MASVSGVQVENQSWLIFVTAENRLAYFSSQNANEAQRAPYNGPQDIRIGREAVIPDQNTPISATSYVAGGRDEVRLYYFKDQYLRELCWNSEDRAWVNGALSNRDIEVSPGSGLSAKQLNGFLKVYYQNRRGKFTVWFTNVNAGQWDTNSIQR